MSPSERDTVAREAIRWIGTPYHHAQRRWGVGVDCAELLAAVYGATHIIDEQAIEQYSDRWYLHEGASRLTAALQHSFQPTDTPGIGDVAVFRFGRTVSHGGIIIDPAGRQLIHADRKARRVQQDSYGDKSALEKRLDGFWTPLRWGGGQ